MIECPVCSSDLPVGDRCDNCGADIGVLRDVQERAEKFHLLSLEAYREERFEDMYRFAMRTLELKDDPEFRKTAACAALMTRRFHQASRA